MSTTSEELEAERELEMLLLMSEVLSDYEDQETIAELLMISVESRILKYQVTGREEATSGLEQLFASPDMQFKQMLRVSKQEFRVLYYSIHEHSVFNNEAYEDSSRKELPNNYQLALTLERLGSNVPLASTGKYYRYNLGREALPNAMRRVIKAILSLQAACLYWPDKERRAEISSIMEGEGFAGCIGFLDSMLIPLHQRPGLDGDLYLDRNNRYSLNVQTVCDCDRRLTNVFMGFPGSAKDSTVYKNMELAKTPDRFFSPGQYLIADSAYTLARTVITPFESPEADEPVNGTFNSKLARSRVRSEHTINILKERWASLQELRLPLRNKKDLKWINRWVVVCGLLHNIFSVIDDDWYDTCEIDESSTLARTEAIYHKESAQARREAKDFRYSIRSNTLLHNS